MTERDGFREPRRSIRLGLALSFLLLLLTVSTARPALGQSGVPRDQIHLSITLGGYLLLGVGYTHWIEEHHALEFTVFPVAYPWEGFPFAVRGGYAWVPSDEVWRAKLGGNVTLLVRPKNASDERFTPILAVTPGIQYNPESGRTFRADLWMSYFVTERVLAPSALEFLYKWR